MKVFMKVFIGIIKLVCLLLTIIITSPYWVLLFAYDLGNGNKTDKATKYLDKILNII